jgi:hypothetical protein
LRYTDPSGYIYHSAWEYSSNAHTPEEIWLEVFGQDIGNSIERESDAQREINESKNNSNDDDGDGLETVTINGVRYKVPKEIANDPQKFHEYLKNNDKLLDANGVLRDNPLLNKKGYIISVSNGAFALGPVGIMLDVGMVIDSKGNSSLYLTLGWVKGLGASAGLGYSSSSKHFYLENFAGYSEGILLQMPTKIKVLKNISLEGSEDYSNGSDNEYHGLNYKTGGFNLGVGAIYGGYNAFTFLFQIPSADFWNSPSKHF